MLKNCLECGQIFKTNTINVCPACEKEDQIFLHQIQDYLLLYPRANLRDLEQDLSITPRRLFRYLKENKLQLRT